VSLGDPTRVTFLRSCAKPLQALPLLDDGVAGRYGFSDAELAVCCASHSGEPEHLERVGTILSRIGSGVRELECGVRPPLRTAAAEEILRRGEAYGPLHNNCSGKHAGMLALARHRGWEVAGYSEANHPVQRRMAAEMARWSGVDEDETETATDGCGVVTFAFSLEETARIFARVARAAARGESAPARIVRAMTEHPFLVGGTARMDTDLMEVAGDRLFVKSGAEGMVCAGLPSRGLGIALKVEDGGDRAAGPAFLALLRELDVLDDEELDSLLPRSRTVITDARDRAVGRLIVEGIGSRTRGR
ncbi:MAG: asparaginase, partial [Longimicrobiales bacterium]